MKTPKIMAQGLLLIPSDDQLQATNCTVCGSELEGAICNVDGSAVCFKPECQR